MERTEVLDLMGQLKPFGMKNAYDEILATAVKRQHEPQRFAGDLLKAEISEKQARSIKYQLTIAKLPLAKDVDGFEFKGTPINESLVRDLAGGGFIALQRNVVLVGGPAPARRIWQWRPPAVVSGPDRVGGSSTPLTWSIGWRQKVGPAGRGGSPIILLGSTSSSSMSSATCRSHRRVDSFCSMWSAASTSGPR